MECRGERGKQETTERGSRRSGAEIRPALKRMIKGDFFTER